MILLFLLDRICVVSALSQIKYNCRLRLYISPICPLCSVSKVPCAWSPYKTLLLGISISTLIPLLYSSFMSQSKILQIHIQSHHPCLTFIAILGTLLPQGICTCYFLCLDIHKAHSILSLMSLLKCHIFGETFPVHPI